MHHKHKMVGLIALLPFLLAADPASLGRVTPNPSGASQLLLGEGTISKGPFVASVILVAKLSTTTQYSMIPAAIDRREKTWNASLQLGAARYDCWAVVICIDPVHGTPWVLETNKQTVSVD